MKVAAGALKHFLLLGGQSQPCLEGESRWLWIYGTATTGQPLHTVQFSGPIVLVVGSEGEGLSLLTQRCCDVWCRFRYWAKRRT